MVFLVLGRELKGNKLLYLSLTNSLSVLMVGWRLTEIVFHSFGIFFMQTTVESPQETIERSDVTRNVCNF